MRIEEFTEAMNAKNDKVFLIQKSPTSVMEFRTYSEALEWAKRNGFKENDIQEIDEDV